MAYGTTGPSGKLRLVGLCLSLAVLFVISSIYTRSQLDIEDAIYLTKNSFKEFKKQYISGSKEHVPAWVDESGEYKSRSDLDFPLESLMNSIFPIDSLITYNASDAATGESVEYQMLGRYASFSPIINTYMKANYSIFPNDACNSINGTEYLEHRNRIVVLLRGGCPFAHKIENVLKADLGVRGVIVGNDIPSKGLITMYANSVNEGFLPVPIIFVTNDDYVTLKLLEDSNIELTLTTASLGNWINIILSVTLSPPLLILFLYLLVKNFRYFRRKHINRLNQELVRKLPVYVYNKSHLIKLTKLNNYLKVTGQAPVTELMSTDEPSFSKSSSTSSINSNDELVVNGIDLKASAKSLQLLISSQDYFPTYKCSICLDRFYPLKSRVLVLSCRHIYHESCLSKWLVNFKRSCPLCNKSLDRSRGPYLLSNIDVSNYGATLSADAESLSYTTDGPSASHVEANSGATVESSNMTSQVEPTSSSSTNAILRSLTGRSTVRHSSVSTSLLTDSNAPTDASSGPTSFYSATSHLDSAGRHTSFESSSSASHMPIMNSNTSTSSGQSLSTRYYTLDSGQSDGYVDSIASDNQSESTIHLEADQASQSSHTTTS